MDELRQRAGETIDSGLLPRVLVTVGLAVVALILIAVAIYAGAFVILAPLML